jgi:5-methyltetrahydropteroyltriglutamate--homocysteine methyltransferase
MRRSTQRIISSHVGALPRPPGLPGLLPSPSVPQPDIDAAVNDIVQKQLQHGIDVVGDGEFGKVGFLHYVRDRFSGMTERQLEAGEEHPTSTAFRRDLDAFPAYFKARGGLFPFPIPVIACSGPIRFVGQEAIAADIRRLKAAMAEHGATEGFLTAISPQTVELMMPDEHYTRSEDYLLALAEALHDEYKAITDAGLIVQVDDPGLAHAWQRDPTWSVVQCREYCNRRVEILNHALRDCPPERVRLHFCWGSYHGPHATDLELRHFIDLLYEVNAECYSLEGANPRHEFEWIVFAEAKLPRGKSIMPGVVSHVADTVEHPELVAQRLERYAQMVGRENVIAGTDCGMMRVHPEICWAKLDALTKGARLASGRLWGAPVASSVGIR